MAYVTPTTVLTNDLIAAGDWNKNTVDNPIALRTGEIALTSQAVGDLVIATSATQLGRVADVAVGQVLVSGGVATAPAYSASPSITALTYTTSLKSTTALATPGALSATQATEFASTVSGAAIMGFGTTNDVSLMNRAGTVVLGIGPNTTTVNMTGLLTVSGFGTHSFSAGGTNANEINVRNTTAGAANMARISLGNDNASDFFQLRAMSSTFTPSADLTASGATVRSEGAGGLNLSATDASGAIRFYSGGTTERMSLSSAGLLTVTGGVSVPTSALGNVFSSTYTPAISNTSNCTLSFAYTTGFFRVGDMVTVSGVIDIDPTASGAVSFQMTIPVASNLGTIADLGGTFGDASNYAMGVIYGNVANDTAQFAYIATGTAAQSLAFTFSYRVI